MYVIVAIVAAGAGVAIAGLPRTSSVDATIISPDSTVAATSTVTSTVAPSPSTVSTTTAVPIETDPPATEPPTTVPPKRRKPPKTDPPVDDTLPPLAEPATITVLVANGAEIGGAAGRTVADLVALGYTDTRATDGEVIVDTTIIYFADPYFLEAVRMTSELGLPPESIAPIADAPPALGGLDGVGLLPYLGRDQA